MGEIALLRRTRVRWIIAKIALYISNLYGQGRSSYARKGIVVRSSGV